MRQSSGARRNVRFGCRKPKAIEGGENDGIAVGLAGTLLRQRFEGGVHLGGAMGPGEAGDAMA